MQIRSTQNVIVLSSAHDLHVLSTLDAICIYAACAAAGTYLFLDADIEGTIEYIKDCATRARQSIRGALSISTYVGGAIDRFQPAGAGEWTQLQIVLHQAAGPHFMLLQNALICSMQAETLPADVGPVLSGNVEISITALPLYRNVRLKKFRNNTDVRNAILASACIGGFPMTMPGSGSWRPWSGWAIDGAFSDFQIIKVQIRFPSINEQRGCCGCTPADNRH